MSKNENCTDQILRNRYTLALSIIACLVIFSQMAIQVSISKNEDDSRIINIAGRQRMLSQRITKCAYGIFISGNPVQRADYRAELVRSIDLWEKSHQGLQHGNAEMGLPGNNSGKIIEMFKKIQERHRIILNAARTIAMLASDKEANSDLLRKEILKITENEGKFLDGMNTIVFQYDSEAKAKLKLVKHIEIYLMLITLLVLAMEAIFIFRPGEQKIREKILEVRENEDRYRQLHQEFQALLNGLPDGMALLSADRTISWANRSMALLAGLDVEEIIGRNCHQVLHDFGAPCEVCLVQTCFGSGLPEMRLLQNTAEKTVELRVIPVKDDRGDVIKVIKVLRDVTEHKNLEHKLQNSQKLEAVGKLAGGIAHDFNNILTAIIGFSSLISMKPETATSVKHYADQILSLSDKAAALTQGLLAFSRNRVISPKSTDLNSLIRNWQNLLMSLLGASIEFQLDLTPETLTVMADSVSLEQVFVNLASNAKDAMPDGGKVIIRSEPYSMDDAFMQAHGFGKPGRYASISVIDCGVGIDEATMEKIFEPFFTTKEVGKGTGLGLASAYGIIEQHGGFIRVSSTPGRGSTFSIYLPLIIETRPADESTGSFPEGGGETVLLADDNDSVRISNREILENHGYHVVEAEDGEEAIQLFAMRKDQIDLLILDLIMPKKSGREVYNSAIKIRKDVKVLFMSGYTADIVTRQGILDEDMHFIEKPLYPEVLLPKMREILLGL